MEEDKPKIEEWATAYDIDSESGMWRFEGLNIYMDNKGRFVAQVKGVVVHKPSLFGMKKFITKSKQDAFEPFTGIDLPHFGYSGDKAHHKLELEVYHVRGVKRTGNRTHDLWEFDTVEPRPYYGHRSLKRLLKDTKENRALLEKMRKHTLETRRIREKRDKEYAALEKALKWHNVDDYVKEIPR